MSDPEPTARSFRRRGLGRGLEALLSGTPDAGEQEPLLISVEPASVQPNPEQPRRQFSEGDLEALAESIRLHGLLHPIVVQRADDGYQLVAGERRLRAAQRAGVTSIPAIVRPAVESGRQFLEMALTENLLRSDLNPLEEAAAYARLADAFGLSHEAIALRLGRSRPTVTNSIRLLGLSARVQQALADGRITAGHARALLALPEVRDQEVVAAQVEADGLSVRETERLVQTRVAQPDAAKSTLARPVAAPMSATTADDDALVRALETAIGLSVQLLRRRRGGGQLLIEFADDADLEGLYRRLGGEDL